MFTCISIGPAWNTHAMQEKRRVAAVFSLRITADSRQEVVGGADVYAPVCRRHYVQLSQLRGRPLSSSDEASGGEQ